MDLNNIQSGFCLWLWLWLCDFGVFDGTRICHTLCRIPSRHRRLAYQRQKALMGFHCVIRPAQGLLKTCRIACRVPQKPIHVFSAKWVTAHAYRSLLAARGIKPSTRCSPKSNWFVASLDLLIRPPGFADGDENQSLGGSSNCLASEHRGTVSLVRSRPIDSGSRLPG